MALFLFQAQFITPTNYKDALEERSIAKLCGYPLCPNKLGKIPAQQYKICTKTNKVYDITERKVSAVLCQIDVNILT